MTLKIERVIDRGVSDEEALSGGHGPEPEHLSLSTPDGQMRVFGAVVFAKPTGSMTIFEIENLKRCVQFRSRRLAYLIWLKINWRALPNCLNISIRMAGDFESSRCSRAAALVFRWRV
jgi:hypothetical protein